MLSLMSSRRGRTGDDRKLADFQKRHGILNTPEMLGNGQPSEVEHTAESERSGRTEPGTGNATTDRIVLEAEYRAAASGDPELVLASDPRMQAPATLHRRCCSNCARAAAILSRSRRNCGSSTGRIFRASSKFAARLRIWSTNQSGGRKAGGCVSEARGRRLQIASNWCAKV